MHLQHYLLELRRLYGEGTPENTYVPTLAEFLRRVLPDVEVIPWPKGKAVGLPDIGIKANGIIEGYVEAEALKTPLAKNKKGLEQALRYSKEAPTVLTNFHEFRLFDAEKEVWKFSLPQEALLEAPLGEAAAAHEADLLAFLRVWAGRRSRITDPEALAERLSDYAREALRRLGLAPEGSLTPLKRAMEEALGISIKNTEGKHFFESSLVQALFYGLFSAWVAAAEEGKGESFNLSEASSYLRVPLVIELFENLTMPTLLKNLDLRSPVDWAVDALKRVEAEPFLEAFEQGQAVQYFYEPFLEKFDSKLRKDLGVWYTPREIVRYQIEKTDRLLKDELGIAKGLLDERVVVLDPATGTGSYLVEMGRYLLERLSGNPLAGHLVKEAFKTRVFGFELLPAPFIIAHLQLGLLLSEAGAALKEGERVGVYLTNSLLSWKEDPKDVETPIFPQFAKEKEAADKVKQKEQILVFIGNPPYDRYAGVAEDEQGDLIAPYKACLYESWGVRKQTLDDLYIRFIRLAEQQIAEAGGEGVVSYISNRSYLTGLSHPVMREHLVKNFHGIYIDDLHGSQRSNLANNGNVFTTETASGIRVGVAIAHLVCKKGSPEAAKVHYREYRQGSGQVKRRELLEQAKPFEHAFTPQRKHRYLLLPLIGEDAYWTWPNLIEIFPVRFSGVNTNRDEAVIAFNPQVLDKLMRDYYDPSVSNESLAKQNATLMSKAARYDPAVTRRLLLQNSRFWKDRIIKYHYRPFDQRWLYWEEEGKLLNEKRKEFFEQVFDGNAFLISSQTMRRGYDRHFFSRTLIDLNIFDPNARALPLKLRYHPVQTGQASMFESSDEWQYLPNATDFYDDLVKNKLLKRPQKKEGCSPVPKPEPVLSRYGTVKDGTGKPTEDAFALAEALFYHTLAVMHTPRYRSEHAEYLAEDWPRIPLPEAREVLEAGAASGRQVARLLDPLGDASDLLEPYEALRRFAGSALSGDLKVSSRPA